MRPKVSRPQTKIEEAENFMRRLLRHWNQYRRCAEIMPEPWMFHIVESLRRGHDVCKARVAKLKEPPR
jgi:hypothetical protein